MLYSYGEEAGREIIRSNPEDFLTWEEQERRIKRAQERFSDIQKVMEAMPSYERIETAMKALGAEMTAEDLEVGDELRNLSMHCAKDYRSRYTLFKLLDECGLLADYLAAYPLK